jgi:hypothetical protein
MARSAGDLWSPHHSAGEGPCASARIATLGRTAFGLCCAIYEDWKRERTSELNAAFERGPKSKVSENTLKRTTAAYLNGRRMPHSRIRGRRPC